MVKNTKPDDVKLEPKVHLRGENVPTKVMITNDSTPGFSLEDHHRVRRMLGGRTEWVPTLKTFCTWFTYGKITKRFCITVTLMKCASLD